MSGTGSCSPTSRCRADDRGSSGGRGPSQRPRKAERESSWRGSSKVTSFGGTALFSVIAGETETIWCGITFDNDTGATGATLAQMDLLGQGNYDPVIVGSSTDLLFQTTAAGSFVGNSPAGSRVNFGGSPVANFGWELIVSTLPVELQSFDVD